MRQAPPEATSEFVPRLVQLAYGTNQLAATAPLTLGNMGKPEGLSAAVTAIRRGSSSMMHPARIYFECNCFDAALQALLHLTEELPETSLGWLIAVDALREWGLHASALAPLLLSKFSDGDKPVALRVRIAFTLRTITLDDEVETTATHFLGEELARGIAAADEAEKIPPPDES